MLILYCTVCIVWCLHLQYLDILKTILLHLVNNVQGIYIYMSSPSSSSSNWILMSCQPHRVTTGQSNSGHKQMHISTLFSHICQVSLQNQSLHKHKTYRHKHQTQIFKELVPSILPQLKEHTRLGHAGIVNHSV